MHQHRRAFTLIELLVVIAIIAILAVVVILTLNPAQLLAQSRDANRVSDMSTLNSALNLYSTDQSGASSFSLGNASNTYVSVADSSSTCGDLGLPTLPSGYSYGCGSSGNYRNASSSGWIPVNFQNISAGTPLSSLPVDPVNQTSSGLYYTYTTTGPQYTVMALMESTKYKSSITSPSLGAGIDVQGSGIGAGPVGWWTLNEGNGSTTYDISGSGNNGTWSGTATGTSGYYSAGLVSKWAGAFDGSTDHVNVPDNASLDPTNAITFSFWIYLTSTSSSDNYITILDKNDSPGYMARLVGCSAGGCILNIDGWYGFHRAQGGTVPLNAWTFCTVTWNGSIITSYINGTPVVSNALSTSFNGSGNILAIGYRNTNGSTYEWFPGLIDDVRIYNRALSPQEIQAIYNAKN